METVSNNKTKPILGYSNITTAALWNEVKNELGKPGMGLSGGQQQRLCIAESTSHAAGSVIDG